MILFFGFLEFPVSSAEHFFLLRVIGHSLSGPSYGLVEIQLNHKMNFKDISSDVLGVLEDPLVNFGANSVLENHYVSDKRKHRLVMGVELKQHILMLFLR